MQPPDPPAVAGSQHPTRRTGRLQLTRLDRQHQPLLIIDLHIEDVHVGNVEDCIGPGAPARTRTTHIARLGVGGPSGVPSVTLYSGVFD